MLKRGEVTVGKANEEYFLKAFSEGPKDAPSWFVSVRRANKIEDHLGFDAFIRTTDVGEIPIQIKSSTHVMRCPALRPPVY